MLVTANTSCYSKHCRYVHRVVTSTVMYCLILDVQRAWSFRRMRPEQQLWCVYHCSLSVQLCFVLYRVCVCESRAGLFTVMFNNISKIINNVLFWWTLLVLTHYLFVLLEERATAFYLWITNDQRCSFVCEAFVWPRKQENA